MSIEYDLVSDTANEGYELGSGPWHTQEFADAVQGPDPYTALKAFLLKANLHVSFKEEDAERLAAAIAAFVSMHHDWRIHYNHDDDLWEKGYRKLGSRYDLMKGADIFKEAVVDFLKIAKPPIPGDPLNSDRAAFLVERCRWCQASGCFLEIGAHPHDRYRCQRCGGGLWRVQGQGGDRVVIGFPDVDMPPDAALRARSQAETPPVYLRAVAAELLRRWRDNNRLGGPSLVGWPSELPWQQAAKELGRICTALPGESEKDNVLASCRLFLQALSLLAARGWMEEDAIKHLEEALLKLEEALHSDRMISYADLLAALQKLTPEQLQQKVAWSLDEIAGYVEEVFIAEEDWYNPSGDGAEPKSEIEEQLAEDPDLAEVIDLAKEPIAIHKGAVRLLLD